MNNKRQHVVPYFYLKEFFPGYIYRKGEKYPRFTKKPGNISVQKDYYGKPEVNPDFPLDKFNTLVENETAPIIKRIINGDITIDQIDWINLSYFFANIQLRNPNYHTAMRNRFRKLTDQINDMATRMNSVYDKTKTQDNEFYMPEELNLSQEHSYSLDDLNKSMGELETRNGCIKITESLYSNIKEVASYIQKMSLYIMEAIDGLFFITTDTPLVLYSINTGSPTGAGWANSDAMAVIPISPKKCLMLTYEGKPTIYSKIITAEDIHFWNVSLMKYAVHEVYSKHPYDTALDWMLQKGMWKQ